MSKMVMRSFRIPAELDEAIEGRALDTLAQYSDVARRALVRGLLDEMRESPVTGETRFERMLAESRRKIFGAPIDWDS